MFSITSIIKRIGRLELATVLALVATLVSINATTANAATLIGTSTTIRTPSTTYQLPSSWTQLMQQMADNPSGSGTVLAGTSKQILSISGIGQYSLSCATPAGADGAANWSLKYTSANSYTYTVRASGTTTKGSSTTTYNLAPVTKIGAGSSVNTQLAFAFGGTPTSISADWTHKVQSTIHLTTLQLHMGQAPGGNCTYSFQGHVDHFQGP